MFILVYGNREKQEKNAIRWKHEEGDFWHLIFVELESSCAMPIASCFWRENLVRRLACHLSLECSYSLFILKKIIFKLSYINNLRGLYCDSSICVYSVP
jgi:hypothetical protein